MRATLIPKLPRPSAESSVTPRWRASRTSGSSFLPPVGTLTISFASGNAATFSYVVNGVSQSKAITRQVFRTPGTLCQ